MANGRQTARLFKVQRSGRRFCDSSLEARKLKNSVELGLPGVSNQIQMRLMKGKVSSAVGVYWPIIPKGGDRQVCLITCWAPQAVGLHRIFQWCPPYYQLVPPGTAWHSRADANYGNARRHWLELANATSSSAASCRHHVHADLRLP